jgi:ATP-binding cassette subfamily B protein
MNVVQIFNAEEIEYQVWKKINAAHRDANNKSIFYYSVYYPVEVISALGVGLVVWYGCPSNFSYRVTFGTVTAFIMFINPSSSVIRMIADH